MKKKTYQRPVLVIRFLENKDIVSSSTVDDENFGWIDGWLED